MSHRRLDERGIALPMAMIFMALLTMLMLAFGVLGQSEGVIASNHAVMTQARAQAESGFEHALWALSQGVLNPGAPGSLEIPLPAPPPAPFDGSAFVTPRNDPDDPRGGYFVLVDTPPGFEPNERRIRARGCVPNCADGTRRAQRMIEGIVEVFPDIALQTPCALCVRGNLGVGGNARIDARDDTSCGDKKGVVTAGYINDPDVNEPTGSAVIYGAGGAGNNSANDLDYNTDADDSMFDGVTLTHKNFDKLRELAKLNGTYFGPGYPNGTPSSSPAWTGSIAFNSSNKVKNGIIFIDTVSGQDIPTVREQQDPDDFATVSIHGNPFVSGTFEGWIVVNGSLAISGNMQIRGLVYAVNDFTYNGTGTGKIDGLVISQNIHDTTATSIADDSSTTGNSRIDFDCEATRARNFMPPAFYLQAGTYREVEGESL